MTEKFFSKLRGGLSLYHEDVEGIGFRFIVGFHGEDVSLLLKQFWREESGEYQVIPVFSYGGAPRAQFCTQRSLAAALQSADIEPGSRTEQQWKSACERHDVAGRQEY